MIAHGSARSSIYQGPHHTDPNKQGNWVDADWEDWLENDDPLVLQKMAEATLDINWFTIQGGGIKLSDRDGEALMQAWHKHRMGQADLAESDLDGQTEVRLSVSISTGQSNIMTCTEWVQFEPTATTSGPRQSGKTMRPRCFSQPSARSSPSGRLTRLSSCGGSKNRQVKRTLIRSKKAMAVTHSVRDSHGATKKSPTSPQRFVLALP